MKNLYLIALLILIQSITGITKAQSEINEIKDVLSACTALRAAISAGTDEALRSANKTLKSCNTEDFRSLRLRAGDEISLNGHFLFDSEFIDSLIVNRKVFTWAQRYANRATERGHRGSSDKKVIFTRTSAVKKKSSLKYSFPSRGHQEIAVVTEPGGAVSMKIYDKTNNKWYRDTDAVKKGKPYRSHAFDLPKNKVSTIEVEITNTTNKDISFVIIGN